MSRPNSPMGPSFAAAALILAVLQGEEHPGLDEHELGGHGDELAGHLQVHPLAQLQVAEVLVQDQRDGDILYLDLIFAQQEQYEVQRSLEVLQLPPVMHHLFQLEYRALHPHTSSSEK